MTRKFDRRIQFDERSRNFPIRTVVPAKPRSYTWAVGDVWLDQGLEGACVGFGWAHELMARPVVMPTISNEFARRIYTEAQKVDEWEGEAYEGTSVLAGAKVVKSLGAMAEYRWCFGVEDLRRAVGFAGPVVIGVNWYTGMLNADAKGFIHATGSVEGGHCVCIFGNNEPGRYFKGRNSWGKYWGLSGNFFISHDDMARLLAEQGEACVPMGRKRIAV